VSLASIRLSAAPSQATTNPNIVSRPPYQSVYLVRSILLLSTGQG
jgi:hypothetical protein